MTETIKTEVLGFLQDEEGATTLELALVIVVLIGLVILFKSQLTSLVTNILKKITNQSNSI